MADNVQLPATGTGTADVIVAADEIAGAKYQRVKIIVGADGTNDGDVATSNPLPVSDAGGALTVDGTVTAELSATDNAVLDTIDAVLDTINAKLVTGTVIGDVNLGATDNAVLDDIAAKLATIDADTSALAAGVSTEYQVDIVGSLPAGTNAIGKLTANSGVDIGDVDVLSLPAVTIAAAQTLATVTTVSTLTGGGVAHDSADSGNPVKVGGRVDLTPSTATICADNDRADLILDGDGVAIVRQTALGDCLVERVTNTNGTSTASTVFGATAGTRNYITSVIAYNSSATAGYVDLLDGSGGTIFCTIPLPAGGGTAISFPVPMKQATADRAMYYDVSGALTTVYLTFVGFKSKV